MFEKNDKALLLARIIFIVFIGIIAVGSVILGITYAVIYHPAYFLLIFAGWFACFITWVWVRLLLTYLCDIKLIRNKLYGENNANLEVFLKAKNERSNSPEMQRRQSEIQAELEHLQRLLAAGIITAEDYEKRKKELTEGR